jgi:uncharacterized protein YjbI with pentapeptide repeats
MGRRIPLPRTLGALALILGAVALLVGLAVLLVKLAPEWLTDTQGLSPTERDEARGRTRTALFAFVAGLIALGSAVLGALAFLLNRRGQITERFTRAIDQLGDDKMEIRLGGIYGLERIAHESSTEHGPIIEVLTAYVRENSPWPPRQRRKPVGAGTASRVNPDDDEAESSEEDDGTPPEAAVDIKAILTVLSRRNLKHERDAPLGLDLSGTNLRGVQAREIPLRNANLAGAQLQRANLFGAQLQGAGLTRAQLEGARLTGAQLEGANLDRAQLQEANLAGAQLQAASLNGAQLQGAYLPTARLQSAKLNWAQLKGARLMKANLYEAQLQAADLRDAHLQGADLGGAKLQGANLSGAKCSRATRWPDGFALKYAGVKLEDE